MSANRPRPSELLQVLQQWLEALPSDQPVSRYEQRMAVSASAILQREWEQGPAAAQQEQASLQALLPQHDGSTEDLNQALCLALREGRQPPDDPHMLAGLRRVVEARLAIDNPKFVQLKPSEKEPT